ncbi:bifunctional nicotinamide-nucleotide adenylyltransferase/Nudix hydroxylase [Burkholderia pseudomultivorans]|uniref:Bifunctional NMN adenylyltransferase/Nudix hydrolase n=1 Tax=Burkholderia pseudomultivorans TaxID=1207504 RepID=A0ABU2DY53_9BURK|nr:bifunctional nicotinamide-nucleotide adenylyltransferase/Nudix hydroxylase [Burkholderia pseudomultivorans]MDR8726215.1 Bifunctional NMN adenylyltransferase/Nudix hydrolase [Burkholderia pseudomultivorans]MDR8732899.1 Bifunctional NMN adenylyltransferase/Nudix hydrolase [Burkholderia pseudomultivorans]MDR8739765.1 Bifunctional NMN adenylyltransferase/Nudix hydrolase [Burkholderia pseudomultivorans]MDR8752517.1 Bifunctional NMN adenylyltransferase/Nudix hydrolase [Burkholderia pseudomultivora
MSTQQNRRFDALVFIGRFQPPHRGHLNVLKSALSRAERVCVLIGSTDKPRTVKDPFSFDERRQMLASLLDAAERERVTIAPVQDSTYNDGDWVRWVQDAVASALGDVAQRKVGLIGHEKDATSYYLRMFPQWELVDVDVTEDISATEIRDQYFAERTNSFVQWAVPEPVFGWLERFRTQPEFVQLKAEAEFIAAYRKAWAAAPYPVTFVTVDAVVVHSGHILLVRRRSEPGRGLWALPGGFVNQDERLDAACIRELREETGLKLPEPVLRGSIRDRQVFDHPTRSLRGRTITHACLFNFPTGELPRVKGSDDADKARWVPLNEFAQMRNVMFEDHFDIAYHFLGKL